MVLPFESSGGLQNRFEGDNEDQNNYAHDVGKGGGLERSRFWIWLISDLTLIPNLGFQRATLAGRLFEDFNMNGKWDAGIDMPIVRTRIVLTIPAKRARAVQIIGRGMTNDVGLFAIVTTEVRPNMDMDVALSSNPEKAIKRIRTDSTGSIDSEIPIDVGSGLVTTTNTQTSTCGAQIATRTITEAVTRTVTWSFGPSISYITACPSSACPRTLSATSSGVEPTCGFNISTLTITVSSTPIIIPCPCLTTTQTTVTRGNGECEIGDLTLRFCLYTAHVHDFYDRYKNEDELGGFHI